MWARRPTAVVIAGDFYGQGRALHRNQKRERGFAQRRLESNGPFLNSNLAEGIDPRVTDDRRPNGQGNGDRDEKSYGIRGAGQRGVRSLAERNPARRRRQDLSASRLSHRLAAGIRTPQNRRLAGTGDSIDELLFGKMPDDGAKLIGYARKTESRRAR